MKKTVLAVLFSAISILSYAQSEEAGVISVVQTLFKAMASSDSTLLRSVFSKEVTMASIFKNKDGRQMFTREYSVNDFAKSVASYPAGTLAEEIWNVQVQLDGEFAQAWCDYAFYFQNKFSHCGVDAFHLIKSADGWKIFHLADTRRKDPCKVPDEIQAKHQ